MKPVVSTPSDIKASLGRVDWTGNPEALRQGLMRGNVPLEVLRHLEAISGLGAVQALAAALRIRAVAVAVALLARAEAASNRGVARLARAVLGPADDAMVEAAARAAGL